MAAQAGHRRSVALTGSLTFAAVVAACISMTTATAQGSPPDYTAIIAAPDRTEADLQTDKRRDPLKLLAFTGARPGMKVLDMGAGGGYSTELMARAVAPTGVVYGQNPADLGERAKTRFEARLKTAPAGTSSAGCGHSTIRCPPTWATLTSSRFSFFITIPPIWRLIVPR